MKRILLPVVLLIGLGTAGVWWYIAQQAEPQLPPVSDEQAMQSLAAIMGRTRTLESNRDPKCHATASRLEDFIYGTPLTESARFTKNELQMNLARSIWRIATHIAAEAGSEQVDAQQLGAAADRYFLVERLKSGDWRLQSQRGSIVIADRDLQHYGSIAYALRAILAVQQEQLLGLRNRFLPLGEDAVETLKQRIDLFTLAALQYADRQARGADQYEVSDEILLTSWGKVAEIPEAGDTAAAPPDMDGGYSMLRQIAAQKIASYEAYNNISMPIFLRNLQVYFARHRWPQDEAEAEQFKKLFTETLVTFSRDLLLGAEARAKQTGQALIRARDVAAWATEFVPHRVNKYEDVIFFPNLERTQQVTLEAYDLDSFRDSGLHWQYLQAAVDTPGFPGRLEPDPFAAELLVENIAQFAVLLLREAGVVSKQNGGETLQAGSIAVAMQRLQQRVQAHASAPRSAEPAAGIVSAGDAQSESDQARFADVSTEVGIDFMHRSSSWLARMIRSYTPKGEGVGNITIPPAFGGSGVAAEDIDNDGREDLLLLSGLGNRLYRNSGDGFVDVTVTAGLDWRRPEDGQPGEPRQPIIADFDNDGWQDILITYAMDDHRLYRNLGESAAGLRFEDVTALSGLGGKGLVGGPATVADFNNDGLLDLYLGYFGDYPHSVLPTLARENINGLPNRLFINSGGLKFRDATEGSGTDHPGWTQAVGHTDLDGDGWQDIIVGNDFGVNAYLRNRGDGSFENIAEQLGTGKPSYTMNIGIADLNDDDFPDIYISNIVTMNKDEKYVLPSAETEMKFNLHKLANMRVVEANDLFLSRANSKKLMGYELSNLVGRGYNSTGWAWDADFFDLDNDGDEDLYVTNGMNEFNLYATENAYYTGPDGKHRDVYLPSPNKDRNVLFINRDGRLQNVTEGSGLGLVSNSRSAAYLDYDNDGDLDIALNNYHERAWFYENRLENAAANWLRLRLTGDPAKGASRDAIGARIVVVTEDGNRIWREVHGTIGYLSVHPKEQHFGLGSHDSVKIEVRWPNGELQRFDDVAGNQRYTLEQGKSLKPRRN